MCLSGGDGTLTQADTKRNHVGANYNDDTPDNNGTTRQCPATNHLPGCCHHTGPYNWQIHTVVTNELIVVLLLWEWWHTNINKYICSYDNHALVTYSLGLR